MKKVVVSILLAFVLQSFIPEQAYAKKDKSPVVVATTETSQSTDVSVLVARVESIKAMDMSDLSSTERKELRKELRAIKTDLKARSESDANATATNGGVYLSVGAILIIILLLILLL